MSATGSERLRAQAAAGLADGLPPDAVTARLAATADDTVRAALAAAEAELGPPPAPYAWLALGSHGRREPSLASDQDHALVLGDDAPAAYEHAQVLATRVADALTALGLPPCTGGYMAGRWCHTMPEWQRIVRRWVSVPEPQAVVEAEVFLDLRAVAGGLDVTPLTDALTAGGRHQLFLTHLARATARFEPPRVPFGRLRHDHEGRVDLKHDGISAVVLVARLNAIAAGSGARSTPDRLDAAVAGGTMSPSSAARCAWAFRFMSRLRLRAQLRALDRGEPPGHSVLLRELNPTERAALHRAYDVVRDAVSTTALHHRADVLG